MSAHQLIRDRILSLQPGQRVNISEYVLKEASPRPTGMFAMAVAMIEQERGGIIDRILDGIVGSAYEYGHYIDIQNGNEVVYRLTEPLPSDGPERTHVSADRRHYYRREGDRWIRRDDQSQGLRVTEAGWKELWPPGMFP